MRENRGPQARLREVATETLGTLERLPTVLAGLETTLGMLSSGGLQLHPNTVRALTEASGRDNKAYLWALWIAVALIALIAFTQV
jgi:ubiquinone biosynthesis protein